ncbi:type III secretion system cytoplasmic ring protein SctQ [Sinorhizobium psoraleae]|uniref:Type III secretion system cytoplasmic ring protein SctQ n=1 Tax=Sinorhizobium psoraleae TaxID=520838 RepID=A0ABT4KNH5_9HYPH|nr:type III secretion system cytoplasmic ring protein SctQ [Sinorhizobium psoraleae]MCZ4093506.1 type III secretion system cytoplasmic ring protein SctQ [Sinorhizobium psoraleae]
MIISAVRSIQVATCVYTDATRIGARKSWQIPLGDRTLAVRPLVPEIAIGRIGEPVAIRLEIASRAAELWLSEPTLRLFVERFEPLARWDQLTPATRANLFECLVADALGAIEAGARGQIALTEVGEPTCDRTALNFAFDVSWDGLACAICGEFDPETLAGLVRWAGRLPRRSLRGLTTSVAFRRGFALLTADEIRSLSAGDAIVIPPASAATAVAVTGERYLARCTRTQSGFMLDEPLLTRPRNPMRHLMTNEDVDQDLQGPPQPAAISEIPIKPVFEAGRLELPLGELEAIGEGHVFTLDRALSEAVDIVAQGRIIGRGELVALEGFAAVRITALTD